MLKEEEIIKTMSNRFVFFKILLQKQSIDSVLRSGRKGIEES